MPTNAKHQEWYVHLLGETLGPLPTETVVVMLRQNRIQYADFIWCKGMDDWTRIFEVKEFSSHLPAKPQKPVPDEAAADTEAAPKPVSRAKPKTPPTPPVEQAPPKKTAPAFPKIRRFDRVPINGRVSIVEHGEFEILNIAEGGVYVKSAKVLPVGTDVKFKLETKALAKILEMTGVVIRHSADGEEPGFGIEFTRINPAHKRLLQEYVQSQQ